MLGDGVEIARELARSGPFAELLGDELEPTAGLAPREAVDATVAHYYHPAGTCAMGAVVDASLRVHGVEGLLRRRLLGVPDRAARQHLHARRAGRAPAGRLARTGLSPREESNLHHSGYEPGALPLSYRGWQCPGWGGTSSAGLRSKKPTGRSWKPQVATGITGQSSRRGTWCEPNTYQSTISVSSSERSAAVQRGRPSPPACWFGYSPAG